MSLEVIRPQNPAELLQPYAENFFENRALESYKDTEYQEYTLGEINTLSSGMDMLGSSYMLDVDYAYTVRHRLPAGYTNDRPPIRLTSLSFEGSLCTSSILKVGRVIDADSDFVRDLCLTFDDVTLYREDEFDLLEDTRFLYVQPHAVKFMVLTKPYSEKC